MSKVEVLVACMGQSDGSLYREMNLQTDAVLASQGDSHEYKEYVMDDGSTVRLIATTDRGVGRNRNKALDNARGEYLVSADQDMVYVDGYEEIILSAFERCPKADIIVFDLEYCNRFTPARKKDTRFKRVHIWNSMRYGTARVAMRRGAIEKNCLRFSTLYGGGAEFSSGEDSLFIREAMRKGLKMYASPITIAKVKQEESSWFKGYNEKYFVDKGVLVANAFPVMKHLLKYYFAFGMRNLTKEFGFRKIVKLMKEGFRLFKEI